MVAYGIWIIAWLVSVNLATLAAFGWDKRAARRGDRRLPETTLLWLVFLGGGIGALIGQRHFRHKTKKQPFKALMWCIIVLQIGILAVFMSPQGRALALRSVGL